MALPARTTRVALDDYARLEEASDERHEFYDGEIFAMAGGRREHSRISANIVRHLGNTVESRGCVVYTSDCRVLCPVTASGEKALYTYPDASVVCGEEQFGPPADTLLNPVVLVEVLSPSTEAYDRGAKFRFYRRIPSLRALVLVASERRAVEVFERSEDGLWTLRDAEGDLLDLPALGVSLRLDALYDGVTFPPDEAAPEPTGDGARRPV